MDILQIISYSSWNNHIYDHTRPKNYKFPDYILFKVVLWNRTPWVSIIQCLSYKITKNFKLPLCIWMYISLLKSSVCIFILRESQNKVEVLLQYWSTIRNLSSLVLCLTDVHREHTYWRKFYGKLLWFSQRDQFGICRSTNSFSILWTLLSTQCGVSFLFLKLLKNTICHSNNIRSNNNTHLGT